MHKNETVIIPTESWAESWLQFLHYLFPCYIFLGGVITTAEEHIIKSSFCCRSSTPLSSLVQYQTFVLHGLTQCIRFEFGLVFNKCQCLSVHWFRLPSYWLVSRHKSWLKSCCQSVVQNFRHSLNFIPSYHQSQDCLNSQLWSSATLQCVITVLGSQPLIYPLFSQADPISQSHRV